MVACLCVPRRAVSRLSRACLTALPSSACPLAPSPLRLWVARSRCAETQDVLYHPRPRTSFKNVFYPCPGLHATRYSISSASGEVRDRINTRRTRQRHSPAHAARASPASAPRSRPATERRRSPIRMRICHLTVVQSKTGPSIDTSVPHGTRCPTIPSLQSLRSNRARPVASAPRKSPPWDPGWCPTQMNQTHALHPLGTRSSRSNPRIPAEKPYLLESPHLGPHGCV